MGMFDTYGHVQLKVGPRYLDNYSVGDMVPIKDGVYFGLDGVVVVKHRMLVAVFDEVFDKVGGAYPAGSVLRLIYSNCYSNAMHKITRARQHAHVLPKKRRSK